MSVPMIAGIYDTLGAPFDWGLQQLTLFFHGVAGFNSIGAFGLGVICLTIVIRGALTPLFAWQLRTQRRIQAEQRLVAPQLQELRKKYRKEPQRLSEEMQKVYKEHGISPFSSLTGCLPALIQMPVLIGLYGGIRAVAQPQNGQPDFLQLHGIPKSFLWIDNVGNGAWSEAGYSVAGVLSHPLLLIIPLLAAGLTFVQSRMMMPPLRPDMSDQERSMANMSRQMSLLFPAFIIYLSFIFPQGLALYWLTNTTLMVIQQYVMVGWGSFKVPAWFPGAGRRTSLSYPRDTSPAKPVVLAKNGRNKQRSEAAPTRATGPTVAGTATAPALRNPTARPPAARRKNKRRR